MISIAPPATSYLDKTEEDMEKTKILAQEDIDDGYVFEDTLSKEPEMLV